MGQIHHKKMPLAERRKLNMDAVEDIQAAD